MNSRQDFRSEPEMSVIDGALGSMKERLAEIEREAGELRAAITAVEKGRVHSTSPRPRRARTVRPARSAAAKRAPRGENRRKILDAIKTKAKTAGEIEAETGIAAATAASTLHALVRAGQAKKATRGYVAIR
jgi:predicted Rossmann fold nucleotide-binding protein DprA/Smf involved in DNA uptake